MGYSISLRELIKRPIIRNDQPHEYLNKMSDEEINQYYNEIYLVLDKDKVSLSYPDRNAAFLAKIIDHDILYRLFCEVDLMQRGVEIDKKNLWLGLTRADLMQRGVEIDKKNLWLGLTRADLIKNKKDLPFDEINAHDFKSSSLSREQFNKTDIIVFQDDDAKLKYIKERYTTSTD